MATPGTRASELSQVTRQFLCVLQTPGLTQSAPTFITADNRRLHSLENPLLDLDTPCGGNLVYGCNCDFVAELAQYPRQHSSPLLFGLRIRFATLLDKPHPVMQDLPDETAETMGNGPDGGLIAQAGQQTPEQRLKVTAFFADSGMRRLVQHPQQILVTFRGATAVILFGTFLLAGTGSQLPTQGRGGKRTGLSTYFRDDLLCRIHSQTGHLCQSDHGVLMRLHGLRDQAVELAIC